MNFRKSDIKPIPDFFDRYINLIEDVSLSEALSGTSDIFHQIQVKLERLEETVYAAEKWPAREILQHCIDTERILSYRALRFARNDQTVLPGFDEELFARNTTASSRTVADLLDEFSLVRQSTILMFKNFDKPMFLRKGICFHRELQVLALGFIIAGHSVHHRNILEQRYFPLLGG